MKILLLSGTAQARDLASRLVAAGHDVTASLAGATRAPLAQGCETRVGGFGGDAGFKDYLDREAPDLVIDATHPFAARITERSARLCQAWGINYLYLLRPEWRPEADDNWFFITKPSEARAHIKRNARVFLATGRQTLDAFANLSDCYLICRQIDPPEGPFPFENGEFQIGRPPFAIEDEIALFKRLKIDWLVVKNAGGDASRSKLDAARAVGLPVLMINRPERPDAPIVTNIEDAMSWVDQLADH